MHMARHCWLHINYSNELKTRITEYPVYCEDKSKFATHEKIWRNLALFDNSIEMPLYSCALYLDLQCIEQHCSFAIDICLTPLHFAESTTARVCFDFE